jgi:hypothetical protein
MTVGGERHEISAASRFVAAGAFRFGRSVAIQESCLPPSGVVLFGLSFQQLDDRLADFFRG